MKRIGLLFAIVALTIVGGAGSALFYAWQQATKLPDWYQETKTASEKGELPLTPKAIQTSAAKVQAKIQTQLQTQAPHQTQPSAQPSPQPMEVKLDQAEFNDLLMAKIADKTPAQTLPSSVKSVRTTVENDTLKTGAVVDIQELKKGQLGTQEKNFLTKATEQFPALGDRKVYIGVEGKPQVQNGKLHFDQTAKIQVGNLSWTMQEAADRLGVPIEKLQERLNVELKSQHLKIEDIQLQNGIAVLKGSPTP